MTKSLLAIIFFSFISLISLSVNGQYFQKSVGLRFGTSSGISYRVFKTEERAFELALLQRNYGLQLTYLTERYKKSGLGEDFFIFYGYGAQIGFEEYYPSIPLFYDQNYNYVWDDSRHYHDYNRSRIVGYNSYGTIGLLGIAGIEYRLKAPITISLDIKPRISLLSLRYVGAELFDFSFKASYVF